MTEPVPENGQQINQQVGGHARVTNMIGEAKYITKVVHKHTTNHIGPGAPTSQDLFATGIQYLRSGASGEAARLIVKAVAQGFRSTKVAYYWQLAILAGRPFDHLLSHDLDQLKQARQMSAGFDGDEWVRASEVVEELLQCFSTQIQSGRASEQHPFDDVMRRFDGLALERREELGRHLALLFTGGLQDRLDQERRRQIGAGRMGRDRRERVPKFFVADPAEPRLQEAPPPVVRGSHWLAFALGLVVCAYVYAVILGRASSVSVSGTIVLGPTAILSQIAAGIFAVDPLMARAATQGRKYWSVAIDDQSWFVRSSPIDQLISDWFFQFAPEELGELRTCLAELDPELTKLSDELAASYGPRGDNPVGAPEIEWLIRWRVERLMDRGDHQDQSADRRHRLLPGINDGLSLSLLALGLSVLVLVSMFASRSVVDLMVAIALPVLLVIGCRLLIHGSPIYLEHRRFALETQRNQRIHPLEKLAWEREIDKLRDRPTDVEMAEWLDLDKDFVRLEAMKRWGLRNADVLTHVVLTEAVAGSDSAREVKGPRRYTRSLVRLFLLTNNGVRHLDVQIDFDTGAENNQRRLAFRYDAIASAQIEEPTVRRGGRRQITTVEGGGTNDGRPRPIRRQKLQLTLLNGESLEINADYETLLADEDQDDKEALLKLEMETSGAVSTLRTLETVAGEGVEWLRKERERTYHVAAGYQETQPVSTTGRTEPFQRNGVRSRSEGHPAP